MLVTSGCFRTTVVDGRIPPAPEHERWSATFFWGLAGDPEFDVRRYCGNGAARVRAGGDALATGLTILTLGVYVPRVVVITCAPSLGVQQSLSARGPGAASPQ